MKTRVLTLAWLWLQGGATFTTYKVKWIIPNDLVDNIRGVERTYRVSVEYRKVVQVGGGAFESTFEPLGAAVG